MTKKQRLNGDGTPHVCEFDADGRCQMHPFTREVTTSNQCGVKGCKNTRDSGAFAGPFCAPCDHDLRTGNFEFGTSVVYEQARKIERAKRIMQRAISWLQIKEAAFTTHKGPAIIEEMQRYVGDLPVETNAPTEAEALLKAWADPLPPNGKLYWTHVEKAREYFKKRPAVEPADRIMPAGWASMTPDQLAGAVIPEKASGRVRHLVSCNLNYIDSVGEACDCGAEKSP